MFLSRYFPNVTTKKSLLLNCHGMPKGCDSLLDSPFSNNCEKNHRLFPVVSRAMLSTTLGKCRQQKDVVIFTIFLQIFIIFGLIAYYAW